MIGIPMTKIASSDICGIGYAAGIEALQIEFHATGLYRYYSVPAEVHLGLLASAQPGKFFLQQIKGRFAWEKIGHKWRCGKCEGGNFPEHSRHCSQRTEPVPA